MEMVKKSVRQFTLQSSVFNQCPNDFFHSQIESESNNLFANVTINTEEENKKDNQQNNTNDEDCFKNILKQVNFQQRNGNTSRLIVSMMVELLLTKRKYYTPKVVKYIQAACSKLKTWHSKQKKNVYKLEHLLQIFQGFPGTEQQKQQIHATTRKLFSQILRQCSLQFMKRPKSQIKNKVHYLRVLKIFNLRCRSKLLIQRNQAR